MSARRGAGAIEYGVLIAVVVAALLTMQIYIKRGLSGRLRQAADAFGSQYAPKGAASSLTQTAHTDTTMESTLVKDQVIGPAPTDKGDVLVTTTTLNANTTSRTGSETVGPLGSDLWQ